MTLHGRTFEELEELRSRLPPGMWEKIRRYENFEDEDDDDEGATYYPERGNLTRDELNALLLYKSYFGHHLQRALNKKKRLLDNRKLEDKSTNPSLKSIIKDSHKLAPHMDSLISKQKLPDELSNESLYRGSRISYGTALIKSGKKPGDTIRDPRYQSFSLDPGVAMEHTAKSQSGDATRKFRDDGNRRVLIRDFKPRRKVLLEHHIKKGEMGLYLGNNDTELEVIYPRDKKWKIVNVRDDVVHHPFIRVAKSVIDDYGLGDTNVSQNVRIYTIERKKKKVVKKKPLQRKKVIKKVIKRKPVKKCSCRKK
jgi:hypothetical protein